MDTAISQLANRLVAYFLEMSWVQLRFLPPDLFLPSLFDEARLRIFLWWGWSSLETVNDQGGYCNE